MKKRNTVKIITVFTLILALLTANVAGLGAISAGAAEAACAVCGETYDNGFCPTENCEDEYMPAADSDGDGVYEIGNGGQLFWFAKYVNDKHQLAGADTPEDTADDVYSNSVSAILTDNIDINPGLTFKLDTVEKGGVAVTEGIRVWNAIAPDEDYRYLGTFDGDGHTVSGLYFRAEGEEEAISGLFSRVGDKGTVKNVGVINSSLKAAMVGAIAAHNYGKIYGCYNQGYMSANEFWNCGSGGIVYSNQVGAEISHCYNVGEITAIINASYTAAGIAGWNKGTISYCYNIGRVYNVNGTDAGDGKFYAGLVGLNDMNSKLSYCYSAAEVSCWTQPSALFGENRGVAENCYYDSDILNRAGYNYAGRGTTTNCVGKSSAAFASGEVAYLLNGDQTNLHFYQTCGVGTPAFTGPQVYPQYTDSCSVTGYGNTYSEAVNHSFTNGICTLVEGETHYEAPSIEGGYYIVKNAGNLFWVAEAINAGNTSANISITADIDLQGYDWTPTSPSAVYGGNFKGNYHVIKNMTISVSDSGDVGFFGTVGHYASITGIGFENASVTNTGDGYTGVLAGSVGQYSPIRDCYSLATVNAAEGKGGGLLGKVSYNTTVSRCFTSAPVLIADIHGDAKTDRIFCSSDTTPEEFASGAITYRLNGDHSDIRWFQKLGTDGDKYPVFANTGSNSVFVICSGNAAQYSNSENAAQHALVHELVNGVFVETCAVEGCNHYATASIKALSQVSQAPYTSAPVIPFEAVYSPLWRGGDLVFIGENNINVGDATVRISLGDLTVTREFEVIEKRLTFTLPTQHLKEGESLDPTAYTCEGLIPGHRISSTAAVLYSTPGTFYLKYTVVDAEGNDVSENYWAPGSNNHGEYHTYDHTVFKNDAKSHWNPCSAHGCEEKINLSPCSVSEADCSTKAVCSICNTEYSGIDKNVHKWNEGEITTAPTCTQKGVKSFTCQHDSSHTKTEEIAALGHTEETVKGKAAACTEAGLTDGTKCSVCGETLSPQSAMAALGHRYDNACDTDCNVCGETRAVETHTDSDANGSCDVCGTAVDIEKESNVLSVGAVIGMIVGSTAVLGLGGFSIYWFVIRKKRVI